MSEPLPSRATLVHAICEGRHVNWDALAGSGDDELQRDVAALRLIADIARVHGVPEGDRSAVPTGAPAAAPTLTTWAHLQLMAHTASGAFGDVYHAWDPQLDREVALKLLRRSSDLDAHADEAIEEGRLLARVRHPNVVTVYGAARADGRVGIWMEFVRGRTLGDLVAREGPLDPQRAAAIGVAVCDALAAVHRAKLVHRDVKPHNVMVADDGRVVLMDFGAGRDERHAGLDMAGTPLYLAPEVWQGAPASVSSDIYGVGRLLQFLVSGSADGSLPRGRRSRASDRVLAIAAQASAREPGDRFASADACARALAPAVEPRGHARRAIAVVAAVLVPLLAGLVLSLWHVGRPVDDALTAWQTARHARAPLSADVLEGIDYWLDLGAGGEFLVVTRDAAEKAVRTLSATGVPVRTWFRHPIDAGHVEFAALAPDGSRVAFVWVDHGTGLADIRSIDATGTVRTLLESPRLKAAYVGKWMEHGIPAVTVSAEGERAVVLLDPDRGTSRHLRDVDREPTTVSLSPDGRLMALEQPGIAGPSVELLDVASGQLRPIWPGSAPPRGVPFWSPSGSHLFFLEYDGDAAALAAVRLLDGRASGAPARIARDLRVSPYSSSRVIGFSGDAVAYLALEAPSQLFVASRSEDGTYSSVGAALLQDEGQAPAWSPDGRRLAWALGPPAGGLRVATPAGASVRDFRGPLQGAWGPRWSRDGRRIAFWSDDRFTRALVLLDVETGATTELQRDIRTVVGYGWSIDWAADGRELLHVSAPDRIEAMEVATGRRRVLYRPPPERAIDAYESIFVSPDGRSLAFVEEHAGGRELVLLPLDARGPATRPPVRALDKLAGWHQDGKSVLEARMTVQSLQNELWQVPLDGRPERSLGLRSRLMLYLSVSPDGRQVAYSSLGSRARLWLLTPTDAPAPVSTRSTPPGRGTPPTPPSAAGTAAP
jgi:Tol biopolymer transport system component